MSLVIVLASACDKTAVLQWETAVTLEDNGEYWFLHPYFETIETTCGQYIDLYGSACFAGKDLPIYQEQLQQAINDIADQPDSWQQIVGYQYTPDATPLTQTVHRQQVLQLVTALQHLGQRASTENRVVYCLGD